MARIEETAADFAGLRVLDLGCGFGWHCVYAAERGASAVLGLDISARMLERARAHSSGWPIEYRNIALEDYEYPPEVFDVVLSSLAFHYVEDFRDLARKAARTLRPGGAFVFSVEHPVFTAYGTQNWFYDEGGARLHWPVDRYFDEGSRRAVFLGEEVIKYHKTITTYLNGLLEAGFEIVRVVEPEPDPALLDSMPDMRDEVRRPMMLLVSARKNNPGRAQFKGGASFGARRLWLLKNSAAPKMASRSRLCRAVKRAIFVPFRQAALRLRRRKRREAGFAIHVGRRVLRGASPEELKADMAARFNERTSSR